MTFDRWPQVTKPTKHQFLQKLRTQIANTLKKEPQTKLTKDRKQHHQEISFRIKLVHGDCCYQLVPLLDLSTHPVTLTYNIELFDASTGDEGRGKQSRKRHSIMRSVVSTCSEAIGQHKCVINPTYIISNWSRKCTRGQLRTLTTPNKLHKDTWFRHTNYSDYNHGNMSPWSVNSGRGPLRIRLVCVGSAAAPSVVNSGQCINPFDHLIGWPLL